MSAWKNGNFSFRNASLTEILKRVSRYYDVTVIREQVFEEEYYTGDVSSDVSLESLALPLLNPQLLYHLK